MSNTETDETIDPHSFTGRVEYSKDVRAIYLAAAVCDFAHVEIDVFTRIVNGITGSSVDEVTLRIYPDHDQVLFDDVDKFLKLVRQCERSPLLDVHGLELHVFCQSLKPSAEYDGVRDGPWSDIPATAWLP